MGGGRKAIALAGGGRKSAVRGKNTKPEPPFALSFSAETAEAKGKLVKHKSSNISADRDGRRFVLERRLGTGGMCEVFAALDLYRMENGDQHPKVAIKKLLPEYANNPHARRILAQEFFKLRHLDTRGVVRVFELHKHDGCLCMSMELLEGKSFSDDLALRVSGVRRNSLGVAANLFSILADVHDQGVIHADIKPGNIFMEFGGRTVLLDFNVAVCEINNGKASSPIARSANGELRLPAYSPCYATPGLLEGNHPTREDDIFGMCCVVYELLQGEHPFKCLSSIEAKRKGILPKKPACLSSRQWNLLNKGLSFSEAIKPSAKALYTVFATGNFFGRLKTFLQK